MENIGCPCGWENLLGEQHISHRSSSWWLKYKDFARLFVLEFKGSRTLSCFWFEEGCEMVGTKQKNSWPSSNNPEYPVAGITALHSVCSVDISSVPSAVLTDHPLCPLHGRIVLRKIEIVKARPSNRQKNVNTEMEWHVCLHCYVNVPETHSFTHWAVLKAKRGEYTQSRTAFWLFKQLFEDHVVSPAVEYTQQLMHTYRHTGGWR